VSSDRVGSYTSASEPASALASGSELAWAVLEAELVWAAPETELAQAMVTAQATVTAQAMVTAPVQASASSAVREADSGSPLRPDSHEWSHSRP
jgi:20S proteasome alpha/beta subunit